MTIIVSKFVVIQKNQLMKNYKKVLIVAIVIGYMKILLKKVKDTQNLYMMSIHIILVKQHI
jgi:hypothetical protein